MPPHSSNPAEPPQATEQSRTGRRLIAVAALIGLAFGGALQKQLQREGFESHLETRVQLGPFKNKHDADKALARARKLGINAMLVSAR